MKKKKKMEKKIFGNIFFLVFTRGGVIFWANSGISFEQMCRIEITLLIFQKTFFKYVFFCLLELTKNTMNFKGY